MTNEAIADWPDPKETVPALALFLQQRSHADTCVTLNALVDSYRRSSERAQATLTLIRSRITSLLDGPYMPNPNRIYDALYPSEAEIDRYLHLTQGGEHDKTVPHGQRAGR